MEALVAVRRRFPGVHLILLGRGPLLSRVKEARDRLGLAGSITVPGTFIEDLSLPLGLADIHCHISLQDACPISILEAMHAGKAVVASRTGGIPEIIEDGVSGRLVGNDAEQIGATIADLLEHPELARALGRHAQQVARSRFSWERVAADFGTLYGLPHQGSREPTSTQFVNVNHYV
jgi:glycosyltransferase involved in cell wall biosynthesis